MSEIAAKANNVFGAGGPPPNRTRRRELLAAFNEGAIAALGDLEARFYSSTDDVDELLETYLKQKQP